MVGEQLLQKRKYSQNEKYPNPLGVRILGTLRKLDLLATSATVGACADCPLVEINSDELMSVSFAVVAIGVTASDHKLVASGSHVLVSSDIEGLELSPNNLGRSLASLVLHEAPPEVVFFYYIIHIKKSQ